jgi:hypothetical protein
MINLKPPTCFKYFPENTITIFTDTPYDPTTTLPRKYELIVRSNPEEELYLIPLFPRIPELLLETFRKEIERDVSKSYNYMDLKVRFNVSQYHTIYDVRQTSLDNLKERMQMQKMLNQPLLDIFTKVK